MGTELREDRIKSFGKQLAKVRKARGFTQEELAHQSGITLSQIARIETGVINTTVNTIFIICETLGVTESELFQDL